MLDPSSPPSWLRPLSLRFVDLSREYLGAAARRLAGADAAWLRTTQWRQAWSDVVHSRRTLEALREAGVTAVALHCDDGFGRVAQADDLRQGAQFAAVCRDLGLRVFARIEGAALYYEALLTDRPGLAAWAQRDPAGAIVPAGGGRPAWRPCYHSQGYLELLKDSISVACDRLEADGVLLGPFGPHACHCERCQHAFRRRLAQRYPDPLASLGLPSLEHVRLPARPDAADPLHYEAAHFRVHALRSALAELRIHLRSISAHLALWAEPRLGPADHSYTAWGEVCAPLDVVTCDHEPPDDAPCAPAGADRYAAGRATRTFVYLPTCPGPPASDPTDRVAVAVGAPMALGGHVLGSHEALRCDGCAGDAPPESLTPRFAADAELREAWAHLLDFAARHEHYQHRAESLAEVALAFSEADVAADPAERAEMRATQRALLEAAIPFDLVPLAAATAARYAVVVVAGQARVTESEGEVVGALAGRDRAVLLIGGAGTRDPYGRLRGASAFSSAIGRERVRCLPPPGDLPHDAWRDRVATAMQELLPRPPVASLSGPPDSLGRVLLAPFRLPTGQATFHLLNVGGPCAEGLRLHVRADLAPTRHAACHHPESSDFLLDCTAEGASVVTALPPLPGYALVITS